MLQVADPALWDRLAEAFDLDTHLGEVLDETRRIATPRFEREVLPRLGQRVLVRYARRDRAEEDRSRAEVAGRVAALKPWTARILHSAQRHALTSGRDGGEVVGLHAWDPEEDAITIRELLVMGLLDAVPGDVPLVGRYRLHPDLPPPPPVAYDFSEAAMDATDDLSAPFPGPAAILQDAAALAAAIDHVLPRRVHAGTLSKVDARKLGHWMGADDIAEGTAVETHPRWGLALRALEALGAVSMDAMDRTLRLDLGLDATLAGETTDAVDRFVRKVLDRDLHPVLPAIQAALRAAGPKGAVDAVIFLDELRLQHRDVLFPSWSREAHRVYPLLPGETPRRYDEDGWDRVEARAVDRALRRLQRIGLVRRADGVFAPTEDGVHWAEAHDGPHPPIWVSSDLEIIVPPNALTAGERFHVERLGRCLSRDVTDRIRLERAGLVRWLAWHEVEEALEILRRRAPGLPPNVEDTLRAWDKAARQVVLTRGVLLET